MLRRLLLPALALLAAAPGTASADHVAVNATITGSLGKELDHDLVANHVSWSATCNDPEHGIQFKIARVLQPKDPRKKEKVSEEIQPKIFRQGEGRGLFKAAPGERWRLRIVATCTREGADGRDHEATTTAYGPVHFTPPVISLNYASAEFCTKNPPGSGVMQVGMPFGATFNINYDPFSMLDGGEKDTVVLRFKGGGVDARKRGRPDSFFAFPKARRAGKARYWLEFDGDRSEVQTIRVIPNPRGCTPGDYTD